MLAPRRDQQLEHVAGAALGLATRGQQARLGIGPGPKAEAGEEVAVGKEQPFARQPRIHRPVQLSCSLQNDSQ
jgi:hypothetical protein